MKLRLLSCLVGWGLLSTAVLAQQLTGTMSGVVKDSHGAVLRGVTVTASSDALVGDARTAVTSEMGTYQFALPPGTFKVNFELSGFKTLKREGVTIQAALKTGVDAAMGMGTVEGTVTVSGEARTIGTTAATPTNLDAISTDGIVLSLDPREGDFEVGDVRIDGKTITEVKGQRPR